MDFPGSCGAYGFVMCCFSLLCVRTEAGCSCVFGLLLDKRGAMTSDNEISCTSAFCPHARAGTQEVLQDIQGRALILQCCNFI